MKDTLHFLLKILFLAGVYFIVGKLGLSLADRHPNVSLVWPPTGISLATLLLLGCQVWPGIFLGAFLVNIQTHVGLGTTLGIATGNTLEALMGAYLLQRFVGFRPSLERLRDVLGLVLIGAIFSPMVSASIGVSSLCLGGSATWNLLGPLWKEWWIGDMLGALVVTPVILTWSQPLRLAGQKAKILEATALGIILITVSRFTPQLYPIFPILVWAALRFGARGASMATLAVSGMAICGILSENKNLLHLQLFMAIIVLTTLTLAAITAERKKAEEDLKKANEELVRLSQAKSEFASIVSHELRTPLSSIKEGIEIVLDGIDGDVNTSQRQCLNIAKSNVDRLARLIDNVLNYSKVESGKMQFHFESTSLKKLLHEVYDLMKFSANNKEIDLHFRLPERDIVIVCDADKIRQVVINLVDNAMKYTEPKGRIDLTLTDEDPFVHLTVEDNGPGIKKEDQERIFSLFHQVPAAQQKQGFGLGLSICKLIIEQHNGKISVESSPGKGCLFAVDLPIHSEKRGGSSADVLINHREE